MKSIYKIRIFPLINTLSPYLISNFLGEVGTYFKVREIYHIKFQNFIFVLFNNENETQNLKTKKKKKMKKKERKHQNINNSFIV